MHYKHLSIEERELIQEGLWEKKFIRDIAQDLGRSTSAVSREIQKNLDSLGRHRIKEDIPGESISHEAIYQYIYHQIYRDG